jgi:hypothetical protein
MKEINPGPQASNENSFRTYKYDENIIITIFKGPVRGGGI